VGGSKQSPPSQHKEIFLWGGGGGWGTDQNNAKIGGRRFRLAIKEVIQAAREKEKKERNYPNLTRVRNIWIKVPSSYLSKRGLGGKHRSQGARGWGAARSGKIEGSGRGKKKFNIYQKATVLSSGTRSLTISSKDSGREVKGRKK